MYGQVVQYCRHAVDGVDRCFFPVACTVTFDTVCVQVALGAMLPAQHPGPVCNLMPRPEEKSEEHVHGAWALQWLVNTTDDCISA